MNERTKVAFLGPRGTYTHQAAEKAFDDYKPAPCSTIKEVFKSEAEFKVVPFENSLGGSVTNSVDLLRQQQPNISGEVRLEIDHVLCSEEEEVEQVDNVASHPQALEQCSELIETHGFEKREVSSTAKAAEQLEENEAAICSRLAAEINRLNILEESVQDSKSNITRFLVISEEQKSSGEKTLMVLEPEEDRKGILASMLRCISGHEINLSYIQSIPTGKKLGEYFFCIEAEAGQEEDRMKKALEALSTYTEVTVLGSY